MPAKTALRGCRHDRPQTSGRACRPSNRSETNKRQQGRTCAEGTTPWEDGVKGVCPPDRPATRRQAGSTDIAPGCMGSCKQYGDARWGNEGCADSGRGAGGGRWHSTTAPSATISVANAGTARVLRCACCRKAIKRARPAATSYAPIPAFAATCGGAPCRATAGYSAAGGVIGTTADSGADDIVKPMVYGRLPPPLRAWATTEAAQIAPAQARRKPAVPPGMAW